LQIWSGESVAEPISASTGNMIEVYIHRLRRKLEGAEVQIRTVRGLGYLLEATGS
jgi:two-component system OmpR family response regulator